MPHGNKDYFTSMPLSSMYGMIDTSELAVRLGSIVNFDRSGNVLWLTGFEEGMAEWVVDGHGSNYSANVSTDRAFSGGYSCKLIPGNETYYDVAIWRFHYLPPVTRVGIEFSFIPSSGLDHLYSTMIFYRNGKAHDCKIRYNNINRSIDYWNNQAMYVPVATNINLVSFQPWWSVLKWVYDIGKGEYDRLTINHQRYSLKGKTPFVSDTTYYDSFFFAIGVVQLNANQDPSYLDNVILTIND